MTYIKKEKEKKSILLSIVVSKTIYGFLKECSETFGVSMSEIVRQSILETYQKIAKIKYGYKGKDATEQKLKKSAQKDKTEDIIKKIRGMSDDQLTAYLTEIGYFEIEKISPESGNIIKNSIENGSYLYTELDPNSREIIYSRTVFSNVDELINDLKKEKKI